MSRDDDLKCNAVVEQLLEVEIEEPELLEASGVRYDDIDGLLRRWDVGIDRHVAILLRKASANGDGSGLLAVDLVAVGIDACEGKLAMKLILKPPELIDPDVLGARVHMVQVPRNIVLIMVLQYSEHDMLGEIELMAPLMPTNGDGARKVKIEGIVPLLGIYETPHRAIMACTILDMMMGIKALVTNIGPVMNMTRCGLAPRKGSEQGSKHGGLRKSSNGRGDVIVTRVVQRVAERRGHADGAVVVRDDGVGQQGDSQCLCGDD